MQEESKAAKEAEWQAIQAKARPRDPSVEAEINKRSNQELAMRQAQATGEATEVAATARGSGRGRRSMPGKTYYYNKETKETTWTRRAVSGRRPTSRPAHGHG